jgi:hypothetical protein
MYLLVFLSTLRQTGFQMSISLVSETTHLVKWGTRTGKWRVTYRIFPFRYKYNRNKTGDTFPNPWKS